MNNNTSDISSLLKLNEFCTAFGIPTSFIEALERCGFIVQQGSVSLKEIAAWLQLNHKFFSEKTKLPHHAIEETLLSQEKLIENNKQNALTVCAYFAHTAIRRRDELNWSKWRSAMVAALQLNESEYGKTKPDRRVIHSKPFFDCFEDAIWCAKEAERLESELESGGAWGLNKIAHRMSHLSMFSSALALEAAANCALASLEPRGQVTSEIERMTPFAKLDIFLMSRGTGRKFDRGTQLAQAMSELISLRNSVAHPKIDQDLWIREIETAHVQWVEKSPHLGIFPARHYGAWRARDAITVLRLLSKFLTVFFLGDCGIPPLKMRDILYNQFFMDGKPTGGHEISDCVQLYRADFCRWDIDDRFLCPIVGGYTFKDGKNYRVEPGYPEDILTEV